MIELLRKVHLYGLWRSFCFFLINRVFVGTKTMACVAKRCLLRAVGFEIGTGTTIVGPVYIYGSVSIGRDCWINRNFAVHGNGAVKIGNNCDIAPDVCFLTGGHAIGGEERRAGKGEIYSITVENGCWIGARATLGKNIVVGHSSVVAACACVMHSFPGNSLVGGVPAKEIRSLRDGNA